jgi:ABC-type transport system involved in multi-copper enzyme maturation permease subunit
MNFGLFQRAFREIFWTTLIFAAITGAISGLLAYALPRVQQRFMSRSFIPPGVREFRNALFGFDGTGAKISDVAFALAWSHPIILALISAHAIMVCTRILASEVERGTVDILMSMPASRWKLYLSETAAWLTSAAILLGSVYAGSWIGAQNIAEELRPDFSRLLIVLANLALVYLLVGVIASAAAIWSDRRVRAVLFALVITVFSILINFLYTLDPALEFTKRLRFLSFLEYYKPIQALMDNAVPWRNMGILGGLTLTLWVAAGVWLSRRDVTTT